MVMEIVVEKIEEEIEGRDLKGVRHLHENGVTKVPNKYILPQNNRPKIVNSKLIPCNTLKLPIIDFGQLLNCDHGAVLESIDKALMEYGFFQVVNHSIPLDCVRRIISVSQQFFELPFEERMKYMSSDIRAPVRYGTSFNQNNDTVFYWRDFLKLLCHPIDDFLPHWPSSPMDLREAAISYSREIKTLFIIIMESILNALGVVNNKMKTVNQLQNGSYLMVVNCYPPCPEPELTLGMPPHSDYGFLTLLLQDDIEGLQIQHKGEWLTVQPIPNAVVVNAGDHLEIFTNGRYKSVLHRVLVNSSKCRMSVASLLSVPGETMVSPSPELINEDNPRLYMDTDFATFLNYASKCESKEKNFLESRKLKVKSKCQ